MTVRLQDDEQSTAVSFRENAAVAGGSAATAEPETSSK
jgi:hypothetical protein